MKQALRHLSGMSFIVLTVVLLAGVFPASATTAFFINEIHYDNTGTDSGEAVEIAGPAGTDLTGWSVVLYNGNGGGVYDTISLAGVLPDLQAGYGTLSFAWAGIQNGSPDGLALVDAASLVVQFLSYEGSFTAVGGPADGMTSTDIGVSEGSGTPVGYSLQLSGTGTTYEDFTWSAEGSNTFGAVNTDQVFLSGEPTPTPTPDPEPVPILVVNEIMQNPSAVGDSAGEWFELFNPTDAAIDIDGWTIADNDSDSHLIANGSPLVVPAGGFLVLGNNADTGSNGGVTVDYAYGSSWFLANGADEVVLFDDGMTEIDRVEYDNGATYPDPNGASMSLLDPTYDNNVGANWCESTTTFGGGDFGTPGAANNCETPSEIELVINEIMQNPSAVGDSAGEWFELFNPTDAAIDIDGWTIADNDFDSHLIDNGGPLWVPSSGYLVLGSNADPSANGGVAVAYEYADFFLGNSGDEVVLLDGSLVEIDRVEYDNGATFPDPNGASMSLLDPTYDNGVGGNWCESTTTFGDGDFGTPGSANDCAPPPAVVDPLINEFVFNHTGSDSNEYLEIFGSPATDYTAFSLLEIEGDSTGAGVIDGVFPVGTSDGSGFWFTGFLNNQIENGTVTILLVENFSGSAGVDLDPDNDGVLDLTPWDRVVDDIAVSDGGTGDQTYAIVSLGAYYDGQPFSPGGASRIPNGFDSDATTDWVRNDFDGYGLPGFPGSQAIGEAVNTPGAENAVITVIVDEYGTCGAPATFIHDIQGFLDASSDQGNIRVIEGIVVGDFDGPDQLGGAFVQEEASEYDGDPLTSEGIFVYRGGYGPDLSAGDVVRARGTVSEYSGLTELTNILDLEICASGVPPAPVDFDLPVNAPIDFEAHEGMLVSIDQELTVTGNYTWGRYGEVDLSVGGRLFNPTSVVGPGPSAIQLQAQNDLRRIQLDDGSSSQNPLPLPPYIGEEDTLRAGDTTSGLVGVMSDAFGAYEIHPVQAVEFSRENDRPYAAPDVGGEITVASFNVLNYFTTLDGGNPICGPDGNQDCRGADSSYEFQRQRDKIIAAIVAMDADVIGLMEIENHPADAALVDLVQGLNDAAGPGTYGYIATGPIGTDAIKVAFIYQPASVTPSGAYAILDSSFDPRFLDEKNRPVLAQTFADGDGALFTVAVNHLKSKGSACDDVSDPDTGDGQGNCNLTRTVAAQVLADWLAGDPTGSGDTDALIIGDLNSYAMEDPIAALEGDGYTNLVEQFGGMYAYSYDFQGQAGYLDHALANPTLSLQVTGNAVWHINADEPVALDYNSYNQPDLYNADPFASSDHDPVLTGLSPNLPPVCDAAYASVAELWPANHKFVSQEILGLTDPDGDALSITIEGIFQDEEVDDGGDGSSVPDAIIHEDGTFELRAERAGNGDGRFYHVSFSVDDGHSGTCTFQVLVTVPHDSGKKAAAPVDGGPLFDSSLVP